MEIGICAPITLSPLQTYLSKKDTTSQPKTLGGASVTQLAAALLDRGWSLRVYTLGEVNEGICLRGERLEVLVGPYRPARRARDLFKAEREFLKAAIERDRPPLVHAHWTYEFALASLSTGVPTLVTVRDWAPAILKLHRDPYRFVRLLMSLEVFRRGARFTAVSPYIAKAMKQVTRRPVRMIPNAIKDEQFTTSRRSYPTGVPIIVSINNGFSRRKNVNALLTAFKLVLRALPDARLVLVGSGYERDGEAESWARENGAAHNVEFVGELPYQEVHDLLAEAALLVHPSLEESFGMTLIEAMAKRTPVIGGILSGAVPWVLGGGKAGTLVDVRHPEAISRAVIGLLSDTASWERSSEAGYTHASNEFRLSKIVEDYVAEYENVLRG